MASVLPSLALLACPVGMGLMMWFMAKGQRKQNPQPAQPDQPAIPRSVEQMREEQRRLDVEIGRLEGAEHHGSSR
ncbi:MAG: hypothetical protein WKF94_10605 [Solirubrobacteraceae bacterium]